jgi:arabinan endo-1,5-alpha-L-arabinosidase
VRSATPWFSVILLAACALTLAAGSAQTVPPRPPPTTSPATARAPTAQAAGIRNFFCHDPSTIVQCGEEFWVFATGSGVSSAHSKDLIHWQPGPRGGIISAAPWVQELVPDNRRNDFWAPDVIKVGDKYLLYYSASTFGRNVSAIGLATNPTLDPSDPAYHWSDQGMVVRSQRSDNFNAIDPAVTRDAEGGLWLAFGSFWNGVKLIQLDPNSGKRIAADSQVYSLARNRQIEAPYVYYHDHFYYLFVNWGTCCRGVNSTYNIRIGRSAKITGPYLDKEGRDMADNGGSLLLESEGPYIGPGHAGVVQANGKEWISFHYEAAGGRRSGLAIRPLTWDAAQWPVVGHGAEN